MTIASPAAASLRHADRFFIGGEWVESRTGRTFENLNPADTREVVGIFQKSGKEDVDHAIETAKQAFKNMSWEQLEAHLRSL